MSRFRCPRFSFAGLAILAANMQSSHDADSKGGCHQRPRRKNGNPEVWDLPTATGTHYGALYPKLRPAHFLPRKFFLT